VRVNTFAPEQLAVGAPFNDFAFRQHDDFVGVHHGGESMRDHQRGAAGGDGAQRAFDIPLRAGVQCAGGFIQDQQTRVLEDGAGDGDALFFTAGEFEAAFADAGVVAVGQAEDEIVDLGQAGGVFDLVLGGAGAAVGDVVADGVIEQHGVLRDDADCVPQAGLGVIADISAVDHYAPGGDVVEAEEQAGDGGFAGAGGSNDGDFMAGGDVEGDAFEDFALRRVAEPDVLEGDGAGRFFIEMAGECAGIGAVFDFLVDVEELEHLLHVHQALFDCVVGESKEVERLVELHEVGVGEHEFADGHVAGGDAAGGQEHDQRQAGGDDGGLAEVQHVEGDLRFDGGAFVAGEGFVEAAGFVGFVTEIFYRFVVQEGVDGFGLGFGVAVIHALAEAEAPGGEGEGEGDVDADGTEGECGEAPVEEFPEDCRDHEEFGQGWDDVEDGEAEDLFDAG
jgi:hypothetical protein